MNSDEDNNEVTTPETEKIDVLLKKQNPWLTYFTWLVYLLIWLTLYAIAIELKFGTVYFMFSILIGICLNTREKSKDEVSPSAYSVFNENCESIQGTFKAEMFEKQLGIRQL